MNVIEFLFISQFDKKCIYFRTKYIDEQLAKMPKYIAELQNKQKKLDAEEKQRLEKREALLQEAKEYFGYAIDTRDPRFRQMQEMKAEEEKKLKKKRKKEEKLKRQASLQQMFRS